MPLPPDEDQRILNRFDELIAEANELIPKMQKYGDEFNRRRAESWDFSPTYYGHVSEFQAIMVKLLSLTNALLGDSGRGREVAESINSRIDGSRVPSDLEYFIGTLRGLKDDYENGFLDDLEERVVANISSDYMAQVEEILTAGLSDTHDHIFAAVMCGAVLEDALRRLCDRQSKPIATIKDKGQPKRLNSLIADLKKANVFNALKADQLRGWAKIRNHAAHGEFSEFNRNDVEQMVNGVRNFLADYL